MPVKTHRGFLASCEQEQLQFSGAIQTHGSVIVLRSDGTITHISENVSDFLNTRLRPGDSAPAELLALTESLGMPAGSRYYAHQSLGGSAGLDLVLTRSANGAIMVEILQPAETRPVPDFKNASCLSPFGDADDLKRAQKQLVSWISDVTGFERVMYYQFLPTGEGEVTEEITTSAADGSYLGLRFPASDIPNIARRIYCKTPWRSIGDSQADPVSLLTTVEPDLMTGSSQPDLTYADLRSVSPVHATYMQNMGNRASFSLPVTSGDELDALISCHSPSPGVLSLSLQRAISDQVRQYNALLREFRARCRVRILDEFTQACRQTLRQLPEYDPDRYWQALAQWLAATFAADGVVIITDHSILEWGDVPDPNLQTELDHWLSQQTDLVTTQDHIQPLLPDHDLLTSTAGFAGLKLGPQSSAVKRLYLYRNEVTQEVHWGGNPDKPAEFHDGVLGISPRQSFAKWVEKKMGYSKPWSTDSHFRLFQLRKELQEQTTFHKVLASL